MEQSSYADRDARIKARDSAIRLLNRLTAAAAFSAVGGVAILGAVSANTIPGTTASTATASATSTSTGTTSSGSSSSSVQSSSTAVSSSSSSGVAVSGGSH